MLWSNGVEMASVKSCDRCEPQSFSDRNDARVGTTQRKVCVLIHKIGHAPVVRLEENFDDEVSVGNRTVER